MGCCCRITSLHTTVGFVLVLLLDDGGVAVTTLSLMSLAVNDDDDDDDDDDERSGRPKKAVWRTLALMYALGLNCTSLTT